MRVVMEVQNTNNTESKGTMIMGRMELPAITKVEAREKLSEWLKPGATVYVVQRHVSRSGMTRKLSLFVIGKGGELVNISAYVAAIFGEKVDYETLSLKVGGAGMDMHFRTVYRLSRALFVGTDHDHAEPGREGYVLKHRTL